MNVSVHHNHNFLGGGDGGAGKQVFYLELHDHGKISLETINYQKETKECSESEREKKILYINTYIWNLERWY